MWSYLFSKKVLKSLSQRISPSSGVTIFKTYSLNMGNIIAFNINCLALQWDILEHMHSSL